MIIRVTKENEWRATEELTREAFWNVYGPGCSEHLVLHCFRNGSSLIKELDMVCLTDDQIVAHIMYCQSQIKLDKGGSKEVLMFGPVSVKPIFQGRGIGGLIIKASIKKAKELGFGAIIITGNPNYYMRFVFKYASDYNIFLPKRSRKISAPFFMALELKDGYLADIVGDFYEA